MYKSRTQDRVSKKLMTHLASVSHANSNAVAAYGVPLMLKNGAYGFCKEVGFFVEYVDSLGVKCFRVS